eukprot:SAG11_NODE_27496_length_332_cov_0.656652_1_plen_29_part_01
MSSDESEISFNDDSGSDGGIIVTPFDQNW